MVKCCGVRCRSVLKCRNQLGFYCPKKQKPRHRPGLLPFTATKMRGWMESKYAIAAFKQQKARAKRRGIGWELTFQQWIEWWGADIERRGRRQNCLQMQRRADAGPYAIGNIYKGTPQKNANTQGAVARNRAQEKAKRAHQARLDALMWEPSKEEKEEWFTDSDVRDRLRETGALGTRTASRFLRDSSR